MANNSAPDHYPYAMVSRVLWQIGKYIIIFIIAWLILFKLLLYLLAKLFKMFAETTIFQKLIAGLNKPLSMFTSYQIPDAQSGADGFLQWVNHMKQISTISFFLWLLGIIVVLYIATIILRHHYREQAPFLNDMESKLLKIKLVHALGARNENMYDEEEKRIRKVEKAARRRIRYMRVHIHVRKEQGEAVPTKQYQVNIIQPRNQRVDDTLMRMLKNMTQNLRRATNGVTFGDMEKTRDGKWYRFRGSEEAKAKVARSVKKQQKNQAKANNSNETSEAKGKQKPKFEPTYPLDLYVDRSGSIEEKTKEAKAFAERMQQRITDFLTSTEKSVTHQNTHVGNTSVMYKYRVAFSKNQSSDKQSKAIEDGLSDALEVDGIIVQGGSGYIRITLPLKEGEDDEVKYDYNIPIDVKTMIEKVKFSEPTDMIFGITPDSKIIHFPLAKQPHLLLAGATGSGKSVNVQQMLMTAMYHATPYVLKIGIIDPKEVDFQYYEDLPYMIANPITDMSKAKTFMEYAVIEMGKRQKMLKHARVRNIKDYNKWAEKNGKEILPYWVIVIDELADLIMQFKDVEEPIKRIAQKARATGIHMIIATQTPRANILTGQIKANIDTRVAMRVSGVVESGIILDDTGAERLKKYGDMLVRRGGEVERAQGAFISDEEIESIFNHLKEKYDKPVFPDFEAIVARENGEDTDESYETGKTPNSTSLSVNANRKKPTPTKKEEKSIKGATQISTNSDAMKRLRQRAKKRKLKDSQINQEVGEQKIGAIYNKENKEEKPKEKKSMDMDFFLGKK